ncbi:isopentenyl phosphate kinase [Methanomethylovorans sp.]|uniref:isopentenyl phosphate kinase n=1 Tax=Methanomethylovorans sp. TaxID=2758717 RepID=UPI000AE40A15|nr:isopentenyl phosphate kinase [Methanomethylovorans sp.]
MVSSESLTILKIGGSVITDKRAEDGVVRVNEIHRIAQEISGFQKKLIIVHGAGSFGHPQAKKFSLSEQFNVAGSIITHLSVKDLCNIVVGILNEHNISAVGVHPMCCMLADNGRIKTMFLDHIYCMLERDIIPVLHGDVVMDNSLGTSVISGDQIVPYLAKQMKAGILGIGSATEGVLDNKGSTIPVITPKNFRNVKQHIGGSENTDVTGGMLGKVQEMLELSDNGYITSRIFNASKPGNIERFLKGEKIGTAITHEQI